MAVEKADQTGTKVLFSLSLSLGDLGVGSVAAAAGHVTKRQRCYHKSLDEEDLVNQRAMICKYLWLKE